MLISCDMVQVEVYIFAHLCKDENLIQLLKDGKDLHKYMASNVLGIPEEEVTKEQRSTAKTSTFGIIYGNGAATLSSRTGRDFDWCKEFIQTFYTLFPKAKLWHDWMQQEVERTSKLNPKTSKIEGYMKMFPGYFLKFIKKESPEFMKKRGVLFSYNPPDIKNYPVQSLSTGMIVLQILGKLFRKGIHHRDKFLFVNTVHDDFMLDCRPEYVDFACNFINTEVQLALDEIQEFYGFRLEVPLKWEIKIGDNWGVLE